MTSSLFLAGAVAIAAAALLPGPDLTPALLGPSASPTSLAEPSCRLLDAGGLASVERCPGHGGAAVLLAEGPGGTTLRLAWSSKDATGPLAGPVDRAAPLEWRGRPSSRGFEPHAAIVRVSREDGGAAAAVLRVAPGEACLVALVAGPDVEAAARRIADGRARAFRCGRDGPEDERLAETPPARGLQRWAGLR